jgi:ABC-2 type transport system permease protein
LQFYVVVVQGLLDVPIQGSLMLFVASMLIFLFTTTSLGILLGTVARSMLQFGLLLLIILLPLEMLSGGVTPRESMPEIVQTTMLLAPTTHFVALSQAILYRGADFGILWPQFLTLLVIGCIFFVWALSRFRKAIGSMV